MGSIWHDLYTDGKRLNRIIRYLETKMKKAIDDDKIIRYANAIAYLTAKKVEITDPTTRCAELWPMGATRICC